MATPDRLAPVFQFLHRFRWSLGLLLLLLLVAGKFHGSSIGVYADFFGTRATANTDVLGHSRWLRSDEFSIFTPFTLSQCYDGGTGRFPRFSRIVRGTEKTDMMVGYVVPVLAPVMVFRPFQLGFFVMDKEHAFSLYWFGRWIFLFLISYEFGLLIARSRVNAWLFACFVGLAPMIQWWYSANPIVEIVAFAEAIPVLFARYLQAPAFHRRMLLGAGLFISLGTLLCSFYPAWQIPFLAITLLTCVWVWRNHWHAFHGDWRDVALLATALAGLAAILVPLFLSAREALAILGQTEYPGSRFSTGGEAKPRFSLCWPNMTVTPFWDSVKGENQCRISRIYSLFPLSLLPSAWAQWKARRHGGDLLLWLFLGFLAILYVFAFAGFPRWLARATGFFQVTTARIWLATGFLELAILFRALSLLDLEDWISLRRWPVAAILVVLVGIVTGIVVQNGIRVLAPFPLWKTVAFIWLPAALAFVAVLKRNALSILFLTGLCGFMAFTVNPLGRGLASIYKNPLAQKIAEIREQDPDALWLAAAGITFQLSGYPICMGARTISSVHTYPNVERWASMGSPDDKPKWNRYAQIWAGINEDPDMPTLYKGGGDNFTVVFSCKDLQRIGVKYLMTKRKFPPKIGPATFTLLFQGCGFRIYGLTYDQAS